MMQLHMCACMHLQKDFALVRCPRCGMVYAPGDPGDEALHRAQHDAADAALRFAGLIPSATCDLQPD